MAKSPKPVANTAALAWILAALALFGLGYVGAGYWRSEQRRILQDGPAPSLAPAVP